MRAILRQWRWIVWWGVALFSPSIRETARHSVRKTEEARQKQLNTVWMRGERKLPEEPAGRSEDGEEDGKIGSCTNSSCLSVGNWMEGNVAISCLEEIMGSQYLLGSHGLSGTPRALTNRTLDHWINERSILQFRIKCHGFKAYLSCTLIICQPFHISYILITWNIWKWGLKQSTVCRNKMDWEQLLNLTVIQMPVFVCKHRR